MEHSLKVSMVDVEKVLPLKSWWAVVAVLPLARRLTVLVVNHTNITPNAITVMSILLRFAATGAFFVGDQKWLIAGAIAFYCAYLMDCMDGAVARLRKQSSEFGRFLDHVGDLVGGFLAVCGLSLGQHMLVTPLVAAILFCHVAEYYISYLTSTVIAGRQVGAPSGLWKHGIPGLYVSYRSFFHARNVKSFFSFPDYECLVFFIFPLVGKPVLGLQVGFVFLLGTTLYTILSTFTTIHVQGRHFP